MPPACSSPVARWRTCSESRSPAIPLRAVGYDVRQHGFQPRSGQPKPPVLVCYGSTGTHGWARKAVEFLGLGNSALRQIPVGTDYRMDLEQLALAVAEDRSAGALPCCVIGTAGTVNTGATDDLDALADFCRS